MTLPFITLPLQGAIPGQIQGQIQSQIQGQTTLATVQNPFGLAPFWSCSNGSIGCAQPLQNISQVSIPQAFVQPYGYGNFGINPGNVNQASQVVALVPMQQNAQNIIASAISSQSRPLAIECAENQTEYMLTFDVPGIDAEDLDISVSGNMLNISGTRSEASESGISYSEISTGTFSRSVALPFEVTGENSMNTCLEKGVLKIRLNKVKQSENRGSKSNLSRKVKIS